MGYERIGEEQNGSDGFITGINKNIKKCRKSKDLSINFKGCKVFEMLDKLGLIVLNDRTEGDCMGYIWFMILKY